MTEKLTATEEAFCKAYALNGGNATEAYRTANPKSKGKESSQNERASRYMAKDKIKARIAELKKIAEAKAEEKFSITVEQRLKWLKDITEAGLGEFIDAQGNKRRENLSAARAAVATMNDMLGVSDENKQANKAIEIRIIDATKEN